jgi:rubrerythrin
MTLLKPTMCLNGIAVYKDTKVVFSGKFHKGINVLRGHNSSGKTTVLDFLAYTLGAENIPWKKEALLCDTSIAEVELNGTPVTIRRDVNDKAMNPLYIYWGPAEKALSAQITDWEVYPFRRSENKLSFTQSLLLAMGLPEAQGDGASNLTMHQFLRVMYADQPSLHSPIFRNDTFDSALTRETVGNYLCGIYDDRLYVAQLRKRTLEKDYLQMESELRSIFRVLAKSQQDVNFEFIGQQITAIEFEKHNLLQELTKIKKERALEKKSQNPDEKLRQKLDKARSDLLNAQDSLTRRELEIADSQKFVAEISARLQSIDESSATRNYFGSLSFSFCPCCLSEITQPENENGACALCKNPMKNPAGDAQVLRMKNELRIQLKESEKLLSDSEREVAELRSKLPLYRKQLLDLEQQYAESIQVWSSDVELEIENISRRIGVIEQEVRGLYETQRFASVIAELQNKRDKVSEEITKVNSTIESLVFAQEERKKVVSLEISSTLGRLLRADFYRQEEFRQAENVQFSFTDNMVAVEGATQFSESSTVVLRHLFHVALLSAADRIAEMRLPRFLMLDGIEDGGIELLRAHRLQEIIVEECSTFSHDYQLIVATSQIGPALDKPEYVVARSFSEDHRSLEIL